MGKDPYTALWTVPDLMHDRRSHTEAESVMKRSRQRRGSRNGKPFTKLLCYYKIKMRFSVTKLDPSSLTRR